MKKTKKIFCAVTAVIMIFSCFAFASCGADNGDETQPAMPDVTLADGTSDGSANENKNNGAVSSFGNVSTQSVKSAPQFVLATVGTEYSAGDNVTVTVILNNAPLTADFDFYITADGAEYVENVTASVGNMQIMADGAEDTFRMMGIVATTENIDGEQLADITFKIPDGAQSGDVITFTGRTAEFDKGRDADGAKLDSVTGKMSDPVLSVKVK